MGWVWKFKCPFPAAGTLTRSLRAALLCDRARRRVTATYRKQVRCSSRRIGKHEPQVHRLEDDTNSGACADVVVARVARQVRVHRPRRGRPRRLSDQTTASLRTSMTP